MIEPLLCIGCCFLLAGFVVDIVSVATVEWVLNSDGYTSGLWMICSKTGSCGPMSRTDTLDAVRAMMVLSVIVSGISLLVVIVDIAAIWINDRANRWVLRFVSVLTFLSAALALIGIIVSQQVDWVISMADYGYSFWLGVAVIILLFIAGLFFLASVIRYYRSEQQRKKEHKQKAVKKDYPFVIPYYNYDSAQQKSDELKSTKSTGKDESDGRKSEMYPFNFDYRYYATKHLPFRNYGSEDAGIINPGFRGSRYSSGYPTTQIPGNKLLAVKNGTTDNYPSSIHSRSQRTGDNTKATNTPGDTRPSSEITSGYNAQSFYGRSTASSRVARDSYGYPLNYDRDY